MARWSLVKMVELSGWADAPERFALPQVYHDVAAIIGWDRAVSFGLHVWTHKRPPSRAKFDPVHGGGQGIIYIPRRRENRLSSTLARIVGVKDAVRLSRAFGGEVLRFGSLVAASMKRRNSEIRKRFARGESATAIAFAFGLEERQVRRVVGARESTRRMHDDPRVEWMEIQADDGTVLRVLLSTRDRLAKRATAA